MTEDAMDRGWEWRAAIATVSLSLASGSHTAVASNALTQGGRTCIAIVLPSVQGIEGNATDVATSLRDVFASYLTGPSLQVVALEARLASQAMEEAAQRHCSHVLTVTLNRKRGGGSFSRIAGQAAGTAAWHVPGGGSVGSAVVRGAAIGTAQAVAAVAAATRAKDEMQIEYRVSSPTGTTEIGPTRDKRKAKIDGEDLLTPLVEKAAGTIVGTLVKK
jgi:hypothetical protein